MLGLHLRLLYSLAGQADNITTHFLGKCSDTMMFPASNCPSGFRVTRKMQEGGIMAATSFGGIPLDFEVTEAERKLRAALLLDGHKGQDGYQLARYNDPFTLPFLRRNEVLIAVEDVELH